MLHKDFIIWTYRPLRLRKHVINLLLMWVCSLYSFHWTLYLVRVDSLNLKIHWVKVSVWPHCLWWFVWSSFYVTTDSIMWESYQLLVKMVYLLLHWLNKLCLFDWYVHKRIKRVGGGRGVDSDPHHVATPSSPNTHWSFKIYNANPSFLRLTLDSPWRIV